MKEKRIYSGNKGDQREPAPEGTGPLCKPHFFFINYCEADCLMSVSKGASSQGDKSLLRFPFI